MFVNVQALCRGLEVRDSVMQLLVSALRSPQQILLCCTWSSILEVSDKTLVYCVTISVLPLTWIFHILYVPGCFAYNPSCPLFVRTYVRSPVLLVHPGTGSWWATASTLGRVSILKQTVGSVCWGTCGVLLTNKHVESDKASFLICSYSYAFLLVLLSFKCLFFVSVTIYLVIFSFCFLVF